MPKDARDGRSANKLPRLDWYPQDYLADTRVAMMTLEEKGAYTDLLWREWLDGPLPNDPKILGRLLGVSQAAFKRIWRGVGPCFKEEDGSLVNPRLERERERAIKQRETSRANGKKGGRPKKPKRNPDKNPEETGGFPVGIPGRNPGESPSSVIRHPSSVSRQPSSPQPPPEEATATRLIAEGLGLDDEHGGGGGEDPVESLRRVYQQITTRWSWAPPDRTHDLELDLRTAIDRDGLPATAARFEAWCHEVAAGRAKSHLWVFLRHHAGADAEDPDADFIARDLALRDGDDQP